MIECVRTSATAITSADGITRQISLFVKTVFQDKTLWITVIAFIISIFVVYTVRRLSVDHAWKIAAASGAVVNIVVIVIGDIVFDIHTSYNMLIVGNIAAVVIGFIMEFFLFSVDYSRTERLQFEDDEYYYYVKAIPKISVTAPEKTVKHINERKETGAVSYTHLDVYKRQSYIRLGQPSTTLSGGEAQRIKLATELSRRSTGKTVYILDEPTTGLHFADVHKLTEILRRLAADGNTVIVIEHNLDVIKTADYIIDIGPEGGDKGGTVVACGTPEEVAENPNSYTGKYIKMMLDRK